MIYFDNAATTPLAPEVIDLMHETSKKYYGNPSSVHQAGRESRVVIEDCRSKIACLLNVTPSEIIFTSGGTEAINLALSGCVYDIGIKSIITSPLEHPAVLKTLDILKSKAGVKVEYVQLGQKGEIILNSLVALLAGNPSSLVVLMHANNEIGNIIDLVEITRICKKYNALFFADTVQTMGKYMLDLKKIELDFLCSSAHKIHGPKGVGFLYVRKGINISPLILGGGQERNMRAGTENIVGIAGMTKAMELAYDKIDDKRKYIESIKLHMVGLLKEKIPGITFNGQCEENGLYTVLSVSFPRSENSEMLLFNLDIEGIAASGGSACHSGDESVSYVLKAIGADIERTTIRFSFSRYNTFEEVNQCVDKITKLLSS